MTEGAGEKRGLRVGRKGNRAAAALAWSIAAASLVLLLTAVALHYLSRSVAPASADGSNWLDYWIGFGIAVVGASYLTVGALVASRRPGNAVGWLLSSVGLATALGLFNDTYVHYAKAMDLAGAEAAGYLYAINPGVLLAIFVPMLFPDGRLPSRRWRPVLWIASVGVLLYAFDAALEPGGADPLGVELPGRVYGVLVDVSRVSLVVGIIGAAASVVLRLWRARGQERQQIKWLVYASSVVVVGALGAVLLPLPIGDFFYGLLNYGFASIPVAVGIAILRYRLYDIDVIINRTLVYAALTALLAAGYFATILALQGIGSLVYQVPFRALIGQNSALATVAATLSMAALFNPLRRRIQSLIDRSFYRRKYDAAKTLEGLSTKLRDETDLEALIGDLVEVVRETMQPAHVSLWLRPGAAPQRQRLG